MYTCKQAIVDLIAAAGPQELYELERECKVQAHDYDNQAFLQAVADLQATGSIVRSEDVEYPLYDLPESSK